MQPATRYTRNGDINLAYQVFGEGPRDLVVTTGWVPSMETVWEDPAYARFMERLASFRRVVLWDKRGTGASDRMSPDRLPTLEERAEDLRCVMAAAGSTSAAHLGLSEGSQLVLVFAASHPDLVEAAVVYGSWVRTGADGDYPGVAPAEVVESVTLALERHWGDLSVLLGLWAPSRVSDRAFAEAWARSIRLGASPAAGVMWMRLSQEVDARAALPAISAPTLVVHRTGDRLIPVDVGRWIAQQIPGARFVEQPGDDHLWWVGDSDAFLDEVEAFLTGSLNPVEANRLLATVLFTDVVDSTRRAAEAGDRGWHELMQRHDRMVRWELARHSGREIKTLGDGFLAAFEGPARAIRCAIAVREGAAELGLEVRAGVHTGECERVGDDLRGLAVNIGARVGALASAGETLVSSTVKDLVIGSGIAFAARGEHQLKGVPGRWSLYSVA